MQCIIWDASYSGFQWRSIHQPGKGTVCYGQDAHPTIFKPRIRVQVPNYHAI